MRVMVATDLSDEADVALREGESLASSPDNALAIVHVVPSLSSINMLFPQHHAAEAAETPPLLARAIEIVRERVATIVQRDADVFVEQGVDYAEIVRRAEAWHANVVVVASHDRSGLAGILEGVTERVVRYAHCWVFVARRSRRRGCVLAATDLSTSSPLPAVVAGAQEARRRNMRLEVVQPIGFLDVEASYLVALSAATTPPEVYETARRRLSEAVANLGIDADCRVLDRPAAAAIVAQAELAGAELIVVSTRGTTALARLALGVIAERVVHGASCSVLVVR